MECFICVCVCARVCTELKLMFNLMIRINRDGKDIGIEPMLVDLERFIENQGIADMKANADTITVVSELTVTCEHNLEVSV
jgi:hypothetical protein